MTSPADQRPDLEREQGTAVDKRSNIFGAWDDNQWIRNPSKPSDVEIDRMLERDGKAAQLEQALTLAQRQARWTLTPGKGDSGERDTILELLTRPANAGGMSTPFWQVLGQATTATTHRRAFFEKVWELDDDGRYVYGKLAFRPQPSCAIKRTPQGSFDGFKQYVGQDRKLFPQADQLGWVHVDPEYAWVHIHGTTKDPLAGKSDLDVAWHCHQAKQKIKYLWFALFLENQALPRTAVMVPPGQDKRAAARAVGDLKNGGVVGLENDRSLSHFPTGVGQPFIDAMTYLDGEAAASVLAGMFNLTDHAKTGGSYALSENATDFFLMSQQTKLVELGGSLTSFVIADLVRWNFGPHAPVPQLVFDQLANEDVLPALNALERLAAARGQGVPAEFIDELTLKVSEQLGLPVDKVAAGIRHAQEAATAMSQQGASQPGQIGAAVGAAAGMVRQTANPEAALIRAEQSANRTAVA